MTIDLYTPTDVQKVRELLLKEQQNLDALTHLPIPPKQACLDHVHNEDQFVRAVLHRQSNAVLGKLENLWTRYLSYWYPNDLQTFLRQAADYIEENEKSPSKRYRHPGWIARVKTLFNQLNAVKQNSVLSELGYVTGSNPAKRKAIFANACLDRTLGYDKIRTVIKQVKEIS